MIGRCHSDPCVNPLGPVLFKVRLDVRIISFILCHFSFGLSIFIPLHFPFRVPVPYIGNDGFRTFRICPGCIPGCLIAGIFPGRFVVPFYLVIPNVIYCISGRCSICTDIGLSPASADSTVDMLKDIISKHIVFVTVVMTGEDMCFKWFQEFKEMIPVL